MRKPDTISTIYSFFFFAFFFSAIQAQETQKQYAIWGDPVEGQKVYAQKGCGKCHSINGVGPAIGPDLGKRGREFLSISQIAGAMWNRAPVENFPVGEIKLVPPKPLELRKWPEDWGKEAAFVYRRAENDFVVYNLHCTHVGCPVNWSPRANRFFSPCHGGVFDADGRVLAGPPPRPLDRYEVKIEKGILYAGPVYRVNEKLERMS